MTNGTIFAPASAPGRAGVAVFRVSGPDAARAFDLCLPKGTPPPHEVRVRRIVDPQSSEVIDRAVVLWFPAPESFTGENVAEFHTHGGRAVAQALLEALRKLPGFRMAEPGEFARRAFENGKLDLTEAEAIADLVNAETEAQRKQALRQMEGELGRLYEGWRARLMRTLAYEEAAIDFSEEELPQGMDEKQLREISALAADIGKHLADHRGERLREGFEIAILGPPNAGKSSLLNALAGREAAIVSSIAGTTRDIVEAHLDLGGYPVTLADTAGLRETLDEIESEGVRRALDLAQKADLKLLVFDGGVWPKIDEATRKLVDENTLVAVNKSDLIKKLAKVSGLPQAVFISAKTGAGIDQLLARIAAEIGKRFAETAAPPLTRARHRAALEECRDALQRAQKAKETALRAEDVRLAARALGRITGRVDVEDLLDIIFRDFCVGK